MSTCPQSSQDLPKIEVEMSFKSFDGYSKYQSNQGSKAPCKVAVDIFLYSRLLKGVRPIMLASVCVVENKKHLKLQL